MNWRVVGLDSIQFDNHSSLLTFQVGLLCLYTCCTYSTVRREQRRRISVRVEGNDDLCIRLYTLFTYLIWISECEKEYARAHQHTRKIQWEQKHNLQIISHPQQNLLKIIRGKINGLKLYLLQYFEPFSPTFSIWMDFCVREGFLTSYFQHGHHLGPQSKSWISPSLNGHHGFLMGKDRNGESALSHQDTATRFIEPKQSLFRHRMVLIEFTFQLSHPVTIDLPVKNLLSPGIQCNNILDNASLTRHPPLLTFLTPD